MSTVYKFRSKIRQTDTVEFYQTQHNTVGIQTTSDLKGITIELCEDQLFELIGGLLRIQSKIKSKRNGGE